MNLKLADLKLGWLCEDKGNLKLANLKLGWIFVDRAHLNFEWLVVEMSDQMIEADEDR